MLLQKGESFSTRRHYIRLQFKVKSPSPVMMLNIHQKKKKKEKWKAVTQFRTVDFNMYLILICLRCQKQGKEWLFTSTHSNDYSPLPTGCLHNSEEFNYGVETWEAYKRGGLSNDLIEEQKKVQEADLLIFQVITLNCIKKYFSCNIQGWTKERQ